MITRRRFLQGGAAAAGGLLLPVGSVGRVLALPGLTKYVEPLPIPPVWTAAQLGSRGLTMAPAEHLFHRQLRPTKTWGYGGSSYLGPTIEARRGTPVSFTARNRLGRHRLGVDRSLHGPDHHDDASSPRASLHLHGGYTEPQSDGYPEDTFTPGQDHRYRYANDQQAGSLWYHDHALGITRLNVYAGLAGLYLLRDDGEAGLPPAPFEIPLVIQDKSFGPASGGYTPLAYPNPWEPEFFGDTAVINGKAWPTHVVARGRYRLRLVNGSSSRIYNLALSPSVPLHVIGTDTGFLERPTAIPNIVLAPGERADVVVDFSRRSAGDRITLVNLPLPVGVISPAPNALSTLMQFSVNRYGGYTGALPTRLPATPALDSRDVVGQRNLLLVEIMDPATGEPAMALLNNRMWDTDEIETPRVDTLEQWNLINLTADTHPIHLHLVQFRLRNRQRINAGAYLRNVFGRDMLHPDDIGRGRKPFPSADPFTAGPLVGPWVTENGWKDTIQAHPGTVTRLLVPFGRRAAAAVPFGDRNRFTGQYAWHCHILDHEDNEMMLPFRVGVD